MKKIAILTINDLNNYGNRLQNYACQQIMKKNGIQPENIINKALDMENAGIKQIIRRLKRFSVKKLIANFIRMIQNKIIYKTQKYKKNFEKRKKNFIEFNKLVNYSRYDINSEEDMKSIADKYDYFFVGSDQIWNPLLPQIKEINLLYDIPNEKKFSYAPSFGIDNIPTTQIDTYKKCLENFKYLSVREERGKQIIKQLTNKNDIEVLIDPTMMLSAEEWNKVTKKPEQLNCEKYILNYFLGKMSKKRKEEIEKIARENNCKIINILDKKNSFYQTGPSEFLYLEKNAFLICTDSFHSSIFAILFNTPFIVFKREDETISMNSRIDTLLSKFKLEDRYYKEKITKELLQCDYTQSYKILRKEREKAEEFLKKTLYKGEQV